MFSRFKFYFLKKLKNILVKLFLIKKYIKIEVCAFIQQNTEKLF